MLRDPQIDLNYQSFDYVHIVSIFRLHMSPVQYSIKAAARRAGLTPHVIRVWERRYKAVEPERTETNRRLYSDSEVERLMLFRHAIAAGHRISNIARLPTEQLRQLAGETLVGPGPQPRWDVGHEREDPGFVDQSLEAIRRMDATAFEDVLTRGLVALGHQGLLRRVV